MLKRKELILLLLIFVLTLPSFALDMSFQASSKDSVKKEITENETILFNMINDMRRQSKLQPIPFSPDLCIVAHTHIDDLIKFKPQDNGCSLHSWSSSGKWTSCCNAKDPPGIQCMKSKPKEITGYPGNGYELIFWGEDNATPADAAALWQQVDASADMILSRGKWKGYQWKALGVGLKDGYAVLWLGDKADKKALDTPEKSLTVVPQADNKQIIPAKPPVTEVANGKKETEAGQKVPVVISSPVKQTASESVVKYYLIVSSVKTADAAKSELKKIKAKGFPEAIIIEGESIFRISISSFDSSTKAAVRKNELKSEFPGIWVFKK